jgi:hypothetical protein
LFSPLTTVSVLALPQSCTLTWDEEVDTGNPTALAAKARALALGPEATLVVHGLDGHVNFIHHPNPHPIRVVEVVPPAPPKLLRMAQQVLSYVPLPPIELVPQTITLPDLAAQAPPAPAYLIPCRASGLDFPVPTYFLDERPARRDWTMIACERSRQIHRHFYGDEAPCIEMCPRKLVSQSETPTLLKCCLLEEHLEQEGHCVIVPWGATLAQVEAGLRMVLNMKDKCVKNESLA